MMYCPKCGSPLNEATGICPSCNTSGINPVIQTKPASPSVMVYAVIGFALAAAAIFFLPPLCGGLGIYMGSLVKKNGNATLGTALMSIAGVCLVIGMVYGAMSALAAF